MRLAKSQFTPTQWNFIHKAVFKRDDGHCTVCNEPATHLRAIWSSQADIQTLEKLEAVCDSCDYAKPLKFQFKQLIVPQKAWVEKYQPTPPEVIAIHHECEVLRLDIQQAIEKIAHLKSAKDKAAINRIVNQWFDLIFPVEDLKQQLENKRLFYAKLSWCLEKQWEHYNTFEQDFLWAFNEEMTAIDIFKWVEDRYLSMKLAGF